MCAYIYVLYIYKTQNIYPYIFIYILDILLQFKDTFLFATLEQAISIFCDCSVSICKYVYTLHVDFK